jgi:acyl-CoA reductase-like NAD-dependent aldehyde dehydrogenase
LKLEQGSKLKNGFYFMPTLLTNVNFEMKVLSEEVFGPVLPVIPFNSLQEVIKLANSTKYGLTSLVYTKNKKVVKQLSEQIKAGIVSINTKNYLLPDSPFGGWKASGIGMEGGKYGFQEMTKVKYICNYE